MVRSGPAATRLTRMPCSARGPGPGSGRRTPGRPWPRPSSRRPARPPLASKSRPTTDAAAVHQRQRRHRRAPSASTWRPAPPWPRRPTGCCRKLPPSASAGSRTRSRAAPRPGRRRARTTRSASEASWSSLVTSSSSTGGGSGSRLAMRSTRLSRPKPVSTTVGALLLRDPGDVERDRGVGEDAGDQDPLARQDAHHCLIPMVISCCTGPGLVSYMALRGQVAPRRSWPPDESASVPHAEPAVDRDDGAGDVAGVRAGQERDRRGDLGRGGVPAERHRAEDRGLPRPRTGSPSCRCPRSPGAITLEVMPREPSSRASDRARPTSPALDAA